MSGCRTGSNNDVILEAVRSCDLPDGATHSWLVAKTGVAHRNTSKSLCYLTSVVKLIVSWKHGKWLRFFPTQEALEAAMPALEAFKADLRVKKLAKERERYALISPERLEKIKARRKANYQKKLATRPPKPPKAKAEPKPVKAKAPAKPKVIKLSKDAPVRIAPRHVAGGPARMPGEPVITEHTRITIAPPPPARLYRTTTFSVLP